MILQAERRWDGLEGVCPKCGIHYYGWSLYNPLYQKCEKCGGSLEICREGECIETDRPPLPEQKAASDQTGEANKDYLDLLTFLRHTN